MKLLQRDLWHVAGLDIRILRGLRCIVNKGIIFFVGDITIFYQSSFKIFKDLKKYMLEMGMQTCLSINPRKLRMKTMNIAQENANFLGNILSLEIATFLIQTSDDSFYY